MTGEGGDLLSLPVKAEGKDSPHEAMVTSTSNLPTAQEQDESDAASVLLYQSCNNGKDPRTWNMQDVANFMLSIGCSNYAEAFIKEVCISMLHLYLVIYLY